MCTNVKNDVIEISLELYENSVSCLSIDSFSNCASVSANNNLKSRLRARKYSKCMKTWH